MLGLLRQGMRDKHCFELCARRGVLHIVLSFFSSPLCDEAAQVRTPRRLRAGGAPDQVSTTCKSRPVDPHLTTCLNIRFQRPHLGPGPAGREAGSENQEALGSRELYRHVTPHMTEALPDTHQPPACHVAQTAGLPTLVGKGVRL